jgi:MFS family permease
MFVSRIIGGVGVGLSTVAVPILQSETLPAHNRGALLVVQSALIIIGVAVASWLCFATLYADSEMQWRFPVACQILFSLIVLGLCPFLCEMPQWLAQKGRIDEVSRPILKYLVIDTGGFDRPNTLSRASLTNLLTILKFSANYKKLSAPSKPSPTKKSLPGARSLATPQKHVTCTVSSSAWGRT